eukprot:1158538-Pelagomonas_calceolata.AAC.5
MLFRNELLQCGHFEVADKIQCSTQPGGSPSQHAFSEGCQPRALVQSGIRLRMLGGGARPGNLGRFLGIRKQYKCCSMGNKIWTHCFEDRPGV